MEMKKAAFLLLLAFFPVVFAQGIESPQLVKSASVTIDENGTVSVLGADVRTLDINLSIPLSSSYQEVKTYDQARQGPEGNQYIRIYVENPPNPFKYSKEIYVETYSRSTPALPASYIVPSQYSKYVEATSRTQSDDPEIRALALKITENSTTPFERVARLAIFVNRHMTYNENLVGQEYDAVWALRNKQGVCVEYSTLFAALARSIGIPARYVNGYVYSDRYSGWLGHAWAEAYVGEWVPVDPTWFEVGSLDALHIEAGKFSELSREPSLLATISNPGAEVVWDTTGKSGAFANNIFMQEYESFAADSDYVLKAVETDLAPGESTLAYAVLNGKDYRVVPLVLAGCTGGESVSVSGGEQYAILEPGKKTIVVWELYASYDVPKNYVFTCPLTLNSPMLETKRLDVRVDPRISKLPTLQATLEKLSLLPGERNSALFALPASRQNKNYYVITPDEVFQGRISSSSGNVQFQSSLPGAVPLYAAAQGGGFVRLEYISGSNSSLAIDSFFMPQSLVKGKQAMATARVSSKTYPTDVQVEFSFGGHIEKKSGRIIGPTDFDFEFIPNEPMLAQQATVRLYGPPGLADEKNAVVSVAEEPSMSITDVSAVKSTGGIEATITIAMSGGIVNPIIKIGGGTYAARETMELMLPAGTHNAVLLWSDSAGNVYEKTEEVNIEDPGLLGSLAEKAAGSAPPCPFVLLFLFGTLGFAFYRC
ncbi:TPA: hypothetical protein HA225_01765 [Candidatus Micrarchaeota archaeon]|nr:hypothetical protein [Candidatus Micrarchaeota archaeon]HIH31039.1 hypothetical protein [Candidatus Micrarchaeota archaeon]